MAAPATAWSPGPDPSTPLRVFPGGVPPRLLEAAARARQLPVEVVLEPEQAQAMVSVRGRLGRDPALRRRAQQLGLPILVIKSDSLQQLQRALERLLERRPRRFGARPEGGEGPADAGEPSLAMAELEDAHAALEECRLAVEQQVMPQGRPVDLLPRSERVRQMQSELVQRYRLRSAVFGRGSQQRLRIFPL